MRYFFLTIVFISCLVISVVSADGVREIELNDGSLITGEIVSMSGGVYTIRSDGLGTIRVAESKIRTIRTPGASKSVSDAARRSESLQERMMSDQKVMEMIHSLKDDKEFQEILQDPEILKAVNAGDIAALVANPKFLNLLNNRTVKDIQKKVEK